MTEVMPSRSVRPDPPAWLVRMGLNICGHCKQGHHLSCKGAVRVPVNKHFPKGLLRCFCEQCLPPLRCLDCGNQFDAEVDAEMWRCLDRTTCGGRVELRIRNDRVWQLIQQCKSDAAIVRRRKREELVRIRVQVVDEPTDRVAPRNPRPLTGKCECCGDPTKGGRFAPGHDAKYASQLRARIREGDKDAYREMIDRGWAGKLQGLR